MAMKFKPIQLPIRDLVAGYIDGDENGVTGYSDKLIIRPPYQREFIYAPKQRDDVIHSVMNGFPLNTMYWVKRSDGLFELLDGQQRTVSICQYVTKKFSVEVDGIPRKFGNLTIEEQNAILDYPLNVYICEGTEREKLDWFRIINIAGLELKEQELRNAVYTGKWLTEAKKYFSKKDCPAGNVGGDYVSGAYLRQEVLETAIDWVANSKGISIEQYMADHQDDNNCNELWLYFQTVIAWVKAVFPKYRKEMKGLDWGRMYEAYHNNDLDPVALEARVKELLIDDDVTKRSGVYEYVLGGDERCLNIRKFSAAMARSAYERQGGICPVCGKHFEINEMHADHIDPWSKGGKTIAENCRMLCATCNRRKSAI